MHSLVYRSQSPTWIKSSSSSDRFIKDVGEALELSLSDYLVTFLGIFNAFVAPDLNNGNKAEGHVIPLLEPIDLPDSKFNFVFLDIKTVDLIVSETERTSIPSLGTLSFKDRRDSSFMALNLCKVEGRVYLGSALQLGYMLPTPPSDQRKDAVI